MKTLIEAPYLLLRSAINYDLKKSQTIVRVTQKNIAPTKIINELNIPADAILPTLLEGPVKQTIIRTD